MPLFKSRFSLFGIIGLVIFALAVPIGFWFTRTKSTETRSKASAPIVNIIPRDGLEFPIVEFGTIEKITAVLGEPTETTPSATPTCIPMPDDCGKQLPDWPIAVCSPPPGGYCPKPTSKPPEPARYIFKEDTAQTKLKYYKGEYTFAS